MSRSLCLLRAEQEGPLGPMGIREGSTFASPRALGCEEE